MPYTSASSSSLSIGRYAGGLGGSSTVKNTPAPPTYRAFVSYSHAIDGRLAPALRNALHAFARPLWKLRAMSVFCDRTDLSVNPDLWSAVRGALDRAEWMVLLASPAAAASKWVGYEL